MKVILTNELNETMYLKDAVAESVVNDKVCGIKVKDFESDQGYFVNISAKDMVEKLGISLSKDVIDLSGFTARLLRKGEYGY